MFARFFCHDADSFTIKQLYFNWIVITKIYGLNDTLKNL